MMSQSTDKEILTPKGLRTSLIKTSTIDRAKSQKRRDFETASQLDNSALLSLNNIDLSDIADVSSGEGSIGKALKQQRELASNTLDRASRISGIPSRLLQADLHQSKSEGNFRFPSQSTVNESDLLRISKNTSTPRSSSSETDLQKIDISSSRELKQQWELASNTLDINSRISGIPSRLLKPDLHESKSVGNFHFPSESTVNESDLLRISKNTSTPRNSSSETDLGKINIPSSRESIFSRLKDILDTDISTHNAVEEFKQLVQANKSTNSSIYGTSFLPAEDAAQKLMADELSWKQKNDIPIALNFSSVHEMKDLPSMSVGEFFQQRSNSLSVLRAKSPANEAEPVPLIDSTLLSNVSRDISNVQEEGVSECARSLSISAIQRVLAETDDTPNKVMDYLLQHNKGTSSQRATIQKKSKEVFSLPVSPDASSTTSFSDNEAIRMAVNEEYMKPFTGSRNVTRTEPTSQIKSHLSVDKSISPTSYRSSSSLTSLPDGKLPIESTLSELVWGCVKINRCVTKQFMLRNKAAKTLRLQCSVSTHEFKIRKDNRSDSDYLSAVRFVLHGHESRPLNISFIPTKMGSAIDELAFAPLDTHLTQTKKQCIRLWGYGGYSNTEYRNASRDNTGKYWLSLGRMDNRMQMERSFTIKNVGTLPSFTHIKIVPKHIVTFTSLKVEPNLVVLLPNEERGIKVTYIPNANDCRILKENLNVLPVTDIGKLEIISGPEVSRARLRRLHRKSIEKDLAVNELAKMLSEKINGEIFPNDVNQFKESPNAIPELLETLSNQEIVITIEQDPNQTLVSEYPEDSITYQTLCRTSVLLDDTVLSHKSCRLEPPSIVLCPPTKSEDCLFLTSESTKTLHYEATSSPHGLCISPTNGVISPSETTEFKIKLSKNSSQNYFKVLVHVENEILESEVKLLNISTSKRHFLE